MIATLMYAHWQEVQPWAFNGFCIVSSDTHLLCTLLDVFFTGSYLTYLLCTDKVCIETCLVTLGVFLHWASHLQLYTLTRQMSVNEINMYRHWSFTIVLIVVNSAYCIPRLLWVSPVNVPKRLAPPELCTSVGIAFLMLVAWQERFHCEDHMLHIGGHLVYDLTIAIVAITRVILMAPT